MNSIKKQLRLIAIIIFSLRFQSVFISTLLILKEKGSLIPLDFSEIDRREDGAGGGRWWGLASCP